MKKLLRLLGMLLFVSGLSFAQTTTVSATVTDSDNMLWANGTVSVQFVPNPLQSSLNAYRINGAPLSSAVIMQGPISLGSGGSFSTTVYDNTQVTPSGSQWQFTVCPNAISKCGSVTTVVSGSGQSITTLVDAAIPAPRFPATAGSYGYADVEAILSTPVGGTYWNVVSACQKYYNGSSWNCVSSSSGAQVNLGATQTGAIGASGTATFPGTVAAGTVSDGTASLHSGSLTGAVNGTFSGTVAAGATNPVTIGGASGSCAGKYAMADGTGCSIPSGGTSGGNWYIDQVNGSDSNSGLSPTQAFATIAKLETQSIQPYQTIYLNGHFREELDIPWTNITINSMDPGNPAILDGSNIIPTTAWTLESGTTQTYQATVAIQGDTGGSSWVNVWENNNNLAWIGGTWAGGSASPICSTTNLDASPGTYCASSMTTNGNITLYVNPTGSTNPITDGNTYEVGTRWVGLWDAPYHNQSEYQNHFTVVNNIVAEKGIFYDGAIRMQPYATLNNVSALYGNKHTLYAGQGLNWNGGTLAYAYYALPTQPSLAMFVGYEQTATGAGFNISNVNCSLASFNLNAQCFYWESNDTSSFGTVNFINDSATNVANAIGPAPDLNTTVNIVNFTSANVQFDFNLYNCYTTITGGAFNSPVTNGYIAANYSVAANCTSTPSLLVNNLSFAAPTGILPSGGWLWDQGKLWNLTLVNSNLSANHNESGIAMSNTGSSLTSTQNTFSNINAVYNLAAGVTLNSNYNTFKYVGEFIIGSNTYTSVTAYISGTSKDTHSQFSTLGSTFIGYSATPVFSNNFTLNEFTITGNVTSSTLAGGVSGQIVSFLICQDSAGGHAFAWPSNVLLGMSISTQANTCSAQSFIYYSGFGGWYATGIGTTANPTAITGNIGGSALTAGQCVSGTATLAQSSTGHPGVAAPSDGSNVQTSGSGLYTTPQVTVNGTTATVEICAIVAGTPTAKTYNVTVF